MTTETSPSPELEQQEDFIIDSPAKAEWAIKTIKAETERANEYIGVCDQMIADYQQKKTTEQQRLEYTTSNLRFKLQDFFRMLPDASKKAAKTQQSYRLPSGKLVEKFAKQELSSDTDILLEYLKANGKEDYIKTTVEPRWGEFKKTLKIDNGRVIDQDGQLVQGVTVSEKPGVFEINI